MRTLSPVFAGLLLLLLAGPGQAMDVQHYRLAFVVEPDTQFIAGTAVVQLEVDAEDFTDGLLSLDLVGLEVSDVRLGEESIDYSRAPGKLLFDPGPDAEGVLDIEVDYAGTPEAYTAPWGTWGMVFKEDMVFTVNVTEGARHWFPCHDDVGDKATVELAITVPNGLTVVAPGTFTGTEEVNETKTRFEWVVDWPIPTYLVHFAAAPYQVVEEQHDGIDFFYYLHPTSWEEAQDTLQHAPQAMALFEQRYGDYPFPKVAFDEIDLGGAVEQPSCISLGTQIFAADQPFEDVVAHEIAHTWFQGVVTIATWNDLWLSEGLATWHEALYHEHQNGPGAYATYMDSLGVSYRTIAEMSEGHFPLIAPQTLFGVTTYRKGALVFHMLRYLVGEEAFDALLATYLEEHKWGNASTGDFRYLAMTETAHPAVDAFFEEWVEGLGYPQFEFAWRVSGEGADVLVLQVQPEDWPLFTSLPVELEFVAGDQVSRAKIQLTDRLTKASVSLDFEPEKVLFDPDKWLLKKVTSVDYPETPVEPPPERPPELPFEVIEQLDTATVETVAPATDLGTVEPAPEAVEPEKKKGGGGCAMAPSGHPGVLLLLLLLLLGVRSSQASRENGLR